MDQMMRRPNELNDGECYAKNVGGEGGIKLELQNIRTYDVHDSDNYDVLQRYMPNSNKKGKTRTNRNIARVWSEKIGHSYVFYLFEYLYVYWACVYESLLCRECERRQMLKVNDDTELHIVP